MYSVDNWIVRHHRYFYYIEEVKHFQFFKKNIVIEMQNEI